MSDGDNSKGSTSWGDVQREQAALLAAMADANDEIARLLRKAVDALAPNVGDEVAAVPTQIADAVQADAYRLRTFQRLTADTARAYDELIAAGGEANTAAYARWREALDRATALIPTDWARPDLGS